MQVSMCSSHRHMVSQQLYAPSILEIICSQNIFRTTFMCRVMYKHNSTVILSTPFISMNEG